MKISHFLFLLLIIVNCAFAQSQTVFPPKGISQNQLVQMISEKKAEQKLEFAFDIHKVLVQKQSTLMWNMIKNYPRKKEFIKALWNLPLMVLLGSIAWQYIINSLPWHKEKYKEVTSERFVYGLAHARATELADFFTLLLNAQLPDPHMQELISELKQKGYRLHVASNIGKNIFIKFKEQLSLLEKNIFDLFDKNEHGIEGKTIDYSKSKAEKPSTEYYREYLDHYDPDRSKLIIFVDDKLVNIPPAIEQGFIGIHFKNAEQLRNDLAMLGLL